MTPVQTKSITLSRPDTAFLMVLLVSMFFVKQVTPYSRLKSRRAIRANVISLAVYGNEKESGQGIARAIKEGIVKRSDLFIVSKLWNSYHDKERVMPICKKQLTDYGMPCSQPLKPFLRSSSDSILIHRNRLFRLVPHPFPNLPEVRRSIRQISAGLHRRDW